MPSNDEPEPEDDSGLVVRVECGRCNWSEEVGEPRLGQSLIGTAASELAKHEGRAGHKSSANSMGVKIGPADPTTGEGGDPVV